MNDVLDASKEKMFSSLVPDRSTKARMKCMMEAALPTLARPIMSLDANEDAKMGALKQILRQIKTLCAQQARLEDMLKEMKRKGDISPKSMTSTGSYEDLCREVIAKSDHICEEIAQNIEAQEQLLIQIQAQNDDFAAMFNLEDYKKKEAQTRGGEQREGGRRPGNDATTSGVSSGRDQGGREEEIEFPRPTPQNQKP